FGICVRGLAGGSAAASGKQGGRGQQGGSDAEAAAGGCRHHSFSSLRSAFVSCWAVCCAGSAQSRQSCLDRGQHQVVGRGLLVPVGGRGQVVAALVRVTVLDGDLDRAGEGDRVLHVEPIGGHLTGPVLPTREGEAVVGRGIRLGGAPGSVEVVLCAGAVQCGRPRFAVDEDHVIPLPVPVPLLGVAQ